MINAIAKLILRLLGVLFLVATVAEAGSKVKVTLILRPSVAFLPNTEPLRVTATVLLVDPKLTVKCPGLVIWWGDQEKSTIVPDRCLVSDIVERRTWTLEHPYRQSIHGPVEVALMDLGTEGVEEKVYRATAQLRIFASAEVPEGSVIQ